MTDERADVPKPGDTSPAAQRADAVLPPPSVDPRISLANERTYLAWIRTSLGLMAAGVAVAEVLGRDRAGASMNLVGAGLIVVGSVIAVLAHRRWEANERRFAAFLPLERSWMPGMLTALMVLIAGAALVLAFWAGR